MSGIQSVPVIPGRAPARTPDAQWRIGESRDSGFMLRMPRNDDILTTREPGKFLYHAFVDRPLERNDQVGQVPHRLPAPADELRLVAAAGARDIDFAVLAGEADRVPFLPLAAIAALPSASGDGARDIVDQPVRDLAELLHRADAGFLIEFALRGLPGILAGIDPALRHLPDVSLVDVFDAAGAATDKDEPCGVDQHHANACSIGQVFVARHSVEASCGHPADLTRGTRRVRNNACLLYTSPSPASLDPSHRLFSSGMILPENRLPLFG